MKFGRLTGTHSFCTNLSHFRVVLPVIRVTVFLKSVLIPKLGCLHLHFTKPLLLLIPNVIYHSICAIGFPNTFFQFFHFRS